MKSKSKNVGSQINLLPELNFSQSVSGRILNWVTTTFRVIVIVTELLVMVAFLSRFWLDAQNTDLSELINDRKLALEANIDFEKQFRTLQVKTEAYKNILKNNVYDQHLNMLTDNLPSDIILTSINLTQHDLQVEALAGSEVSIQQYLVLLTDNKSFSDVQLTELRYSQSTGNVLKFRILAKRAGAALPKN